MAPYNFEGDIENITDLQLEFINNVIQEHGFENGKVSIEPVGKVGDNFVASVKRITVEGQNGCMKMVAKTAPTTDEVNDKSQNVLQLFKNEHIMYTEILPKMTQLQKNANIPEEEQLRYPKCYGSLSEQPNQVLLLEDLKTSDFMNLDRFESLSNETVRSVLKNFAQFHSLSYVLRKKEPETYNNFKSNLIEFPMTYIVDKMKADFQGDDDGPLSVLENPEHVELLRHTIADTNSLWDKLSEDDTDNKYSVITQGDSWTNNIMFRFEDNKLAESIMIDYQLSVNSSPVYDIMFMIFNCTDHETRSQNFHDWMDYYYSELEKSLSNFNLEAEHVYPRDELSADLKRYGKFMLGLLVCLTNLLSRKAGDAAKMMEDQNIVQLDEETRMRFKNRFVGLISSFTEFGLC
ncbi:uncharacterized protein LOC142980649 [Anticarsia gemmatalis]|uniref:uncharacterized protein LOC142980649 n=1 Tax=Anticarsia gemmatalis TaxID=129554 RepID=UPI003F75F072